MNLTDLREELTTRANSTDNTPDLLPGVRAKIARTKRRRTAGAAGAIGCLALITAVASGLIPTTAPQPADDVPRDVTKDGVVLNARVGTDRLEKGWIGDPGQSSLRFSWTPAGKAVRFYTFCNPHEGDVRTVTLSVNDRIVGTTECTDAPAANGDGIRIPADHVFWLTAPAGRPAQVTVQLSNAAFQPVQDDSVQLALGIYQTGDTPQDGHPPTQAPPASAGDYVKDGIRYRAKVGGDTLIAAKIADRGTGDLAFTFTNPGGRISLSGFCTATRAGLDPQYKLSIKLNGEVFTPSCSSESTDAALGTSLVPPHSWQTGQLVDVQVQLQDKNGKRVKKSDDWIGLGIYAKGKQRAVGDHFLDEVKEYGGRNYQLAEVKQADAKTTKELQLATPAGKPFLVAYGTVGLVGDNPSVSVRGLTHGSSSVGGGIGLVGQGARAAATTKVTLSTGQYTNGHLLLALYLPAD